MKLPLLFALAIAGTATWANDGYAIDTGGALNFSRSPHVQMVSEDIRMWLDDDRARVEVNFIFKNHGPRHTLTMAFPDQAYNIDPPMMEGPKSWVDGRLTPMKYRRVEKTGDEEDSTSYGVWAKQVTFGKGQTRRVRFTYQVKHSWNVANEARASYILRTGATWRGPIEEAKVTVDWSRVKKRYPPIISEWHDEGRKLSGPEWKFGEKRATRVYRNFVPDFDLHFEMNPSFRHVLLNGDSMGEIYPRVHYIGDPSDLEIAVASIPRFFQDLEALQPKDWTNPVTRFFGGRIDFPNANSMLLGGRRTVQLKRPTFVGKGPKYWSENGVEMVYLRDVIEGVGGSYRYDARSGRVDLRIPAERR